MLQIHSICVACKSARKLATQRTSEDFVRPWVHFKQLMPLRAAQGQVATSHEQCPRLHGQGPHLLHPRGHAALAPVACQTNYSERSPTKAQEFRGPGGLTEGK